MKVNGVVTVTIDRCSLRVGGTDVLGPLILKEGCKVIEPIEESCRGLKFIRILRIVVYPILLPTFTVTLSEDSYVGVGPPD